MAEEYVAAYWKVKAGREEEFTKRWRDFTDWSAKQAPGAKSFTLFHNTEEPQYFISYGIWTDMSSIEAWWEMPGFPERYGQVAELCDEHVGATQTLEAVITPTS